jgi:hypothetical protein
VRSVLEAYRRRQPRGPNRFGHDGGPVILAAVAASAGVSTAEVLVQVVGRWLEELPPRLAAVGAFGGLGGFLAALRAAATIVPELGGLAHGLDDGTGQWEPDIRWRTSKVAWADYDLFRGPAGLVIAGVSGGRSAVLFERATRHLAVLCDDPSLEALRAGKKIDPRSAFNIGRINTGMGHGVAGVASALRHAVDSFDDGEIWRRPLANAAAWLVNEAYLAKRDLITWPPVGRDGARPSAEADWRQAWCYGTPGVAWTLWEAGRVLGEIAYQELAEEAMASFCRVFDEDKHIDKGGPAEALSICHGAAGTLAVADAFARHARLEEASRLAQYLEGYLAARADEIRTLAETNMTMLTGTGGILTVLMTVHGATRDWLPHIALR